MPTPRNVLMWNKGRRAIQRYGIFYRRRAEVFTALYIVIVIIFAVYQIVAIFVSTNVGISESMVIITTIALLVTIVILKMIFAGIKLNRQRKLMVASLKDYLVRIRLGSLSQTDEFIDNVEAMKTNTTASSSLDDLKKELKGGIKLHKDSAEYHKAINWSMVLWKQKRLRKKQGY